MNCIFTGCSILNKQNDLTYNVDVSINENGDIVTNRNVGYTASPDAAFHIIVDSIVEEDGVWYLNNPDYSKFFKKYVEEQLKYFSVGDFYYNQISNFLNNVK